MQNLHEGAVSDEDLGADAKSRFSSSKAGTRSAIKQTRIVAILMGDNKPQNQRTFPPGSSLTENQPLAEKTRVPVRRR
jgi:hypothetical protein